MELLAEILLLLTTLGLVGFMLFEYVSGKGDLLSARNVAILGFIVFQSFSGYLWLREDRYQLGYLLQDPGSAGMQFAVAALLFAVIALASYAKAPGTGLGARIAPVSRAMPNDATMILFAVSLLGLAVVMRFSVFIPYVAILTNSLGISLCGVAAGIAGWLIGRHLLNPIYLVVAGCIILGSLAIPLSGAYGRRAIVSVGLGVAWGIYFSRFRYERPFKTIQITVLAVLPAMIFFGIFSSIRGGAARRGSLAEIAGAMLSSGNPLKGLKDLDGQGTGGVSMWLMQNIGPDGLRGQEPLATFLYTFWYPVPRALVPAKPNPITMQIPDLANIQNVAAGLNIGPGIVGHAFADGGWVVLVFYAIVAGWLLRNIDEVVRRNPLAPFVVLPIGSTLGELLGSVRGETGYMLFEFLFGTAGAFLSIVFVGKVLELTGNAQVGSAEVEAPEFEHDDDGYTEYDEYTEYEDDGYHDYGEDDYGEDDPNARGS